MDTRHQLIVFSGLPGTGKSTLAEITARKYGIPLFARDRLEAAVVVSGLEFPTKRNDYPNLSDVGLSILSVLAEQQLALGQSAYSTVQPGLKKCGTNG